MKRARAISGRLIGFYEHEFMELPKRTRKKIRKLMARISEHSYRRGAQHGAYFQKHEAIAHDLHDWRYRRNLDKAQALDTKWTRTAAEILDIEWGPELHEVGL